MNQIMLLKQVNKTHKKFFSIQLILSIIAVIIGIIYFMSEWKEKNQMQKVSDNINKAFEIETMYGAQKIIVEEENISNKYFGKIMIPKLELEYSVFNECNDELLKILPCKFWGVNINEKGNICIAGHNYNDTRFFSKLDKLKNGDTIYLSDLNGKNYKYIVYDKYKVKPDNFECLKAQKMYDLTLVTCDNLNNKRLVVRAERN